MSRADDLAALRVTLQRRYKTARITTNDDANPATPMAITAKWNEGRISKTVRADSITATIEDLERKAVSILDRFSKENIPSKFLEQQA